MQTMTEQKKRYTILGIFVAMFLLELFSCGRQVFILMKIRKKEFCI